MANNRVDVMQILPWVGLAVGGVLVYKIAQGFGIIDSQVEIDKKNQIDTVVGNEANQAGAATLSPAQISVMASQIYEALKYSALSDDKTVAMNELFKLRNNADWLKLVVAFGVQQEYYFGLPLGNKKNLIEFINSNMSNAMKAALNQYFAQQGIKQSF